MSNLIKIIRYFFHHEVSGELTKRVHQRLAVPGDEKEKEDALQALWGESGFAGLPAAQTRQAWAEVEKRLGLPAARTKGSRLFLSPVPAWMRIAALWLIPLLSLGGAFYMYREAKQMEDAIADVAFVEHYVPAGKREQVMLPDSSKVWLNSGTLLIYPSAFVGDARQVYLAGEGYFEVKKSETKPFVVKTNALKVEVLGTKFNLSAYPEAEKITTTLEQGSVRVRLNAPQPPQTFLLKPDNQLVYSPATGRVQQLNVKASDYSDWKEGGLLFSNSSFKDILKTLERTYNIAVLSEASAYDENRLTIHFNKNESLENVLMLIKEMIPGLQYRIDGDRLIIK